VCVCVREREGEECVCERERERERVRVCGCCGCERETGGGVQGETNLPPTMVDVKENAGFSTEKRAWL
jgi:hypothetical protein